MRVLIAANAVRMGGAEQHLLGLLPELVSAAPGVTWHVVTNPALVAKLEQGAAGVSVEGLATQDMPAFERLLAEQRLLSERARGLAADVVLSFNGFLTWGVPCPQVLVAANALYFCPTFWREVRQLGATAWLAARLRALLLAWSMGRARRVIAPSAWMADQLSQRYRGAADRVRVVPHGVNPIFFESRQPEPGRSGQPPWRILAASRHGINKDFDTLVRASLSLTVGGAYALRVRLTGDSSESRYARRTADLISSLRLNGKVGFLGDLSQRDLALAHREHDLFIFPSWCESFGLPQVEAAASGMALIAPDLPVSRELLGDAARYYQPRQTASLAREIASLLGDSDARLELGSRARAQVSGYTWPAAARATVEVLHEAVGAGSRSAA